MTSRFDQADSLDVAEQVENLWMRLLDVHFFHGLSHVLLHQPNNCIDGMVHATVLRVASKNVTQRGQGGWVTDDADRHDVPIPHPPVRLGILKPPFESRANFALAHPRSSSVSECALKSSP